MTPLGSDSLRRDGKAPFREYRGPVSAIVSVTANVLEVMFLEKIGPVAGGYIEKRLTPSLVPDEDHRYTSVVRVRIVSGLFSRA